jgi:hypothetical protein
VEDGAASNDPFGVRLNRGLSTTILTQASVRGTRIMSEEKFVVGAFSLATAFE